jgi:hypothetical protein
MTPYEIKLLLHYYACRDEPPGDEPIRADTKAEFVHQGLLKALVEANQYGCYVEATDKLRTYCEWLCEVPLPVQKWARPDE